MKNELNWIFLEFRNQANNSGFKKMAAILAESVEKYWKKIKLSESVLVSFVFE